MTTEPLPLKGIKVKICVDCEPRPKPLRAPYPGPRCYHHNIAKRRATRARQAVTHALRRYGMPAAFRDRLWAYQGRMCAICHRSKGKTRACSIDHDHARPDGPESWRGLICQKCNTYLGFIRDDPEVGRRMSRYLEHPPAQELLIAWDGELEVSS